MGLGQLCQHNLKYDKYQAYGRKFFENLIKMQSSQFAEMRSIEQSLTLIQQSEISQLRIHCIDTLCTVPHFHVVQWAENS